MSIIAEGRLEVEFECRSSNNPEEESQDGAPSTDGSPSTDSEDSQSETSPGSRGISITPRVEISDEIKYKVEADRNGIEVKVEYEQEYEEETAGDEEEISVESETEFEITFEKIIEYAKNKTSTSIEGEAYDWELDEIVQTLELGSWADFTAVANDTSNTVSYFSATTEDQIVSFNFTISRANQDEKLTANTMKIDMHIINFPWMRDDTYLALMSSVKSKSEIDVDYDDEATAVLSQQQQEQIQRIMAPEDVVFSFQNLQDTNGVAAFGEYKWETTAEVISNVTEGETVAVPADGEGALTARQGSPAMNQSTSSEVIQVVASSPPGNQTTQSIAYSFVGPAAQGASHIYWDPEAGIRYSEESVSSAVSAAFIGSIVGGLLLSMFSVIGF